METIEELKGKIKEKPQSWEGEIFHFTCSLACKLTKEIFEEMEIVGFRERWVVSLFGDIKFKRRLCRDKEGNCHFPLDERIGLDKRSHVSPMMKKLAVQSSTDYTFREVERNMEAIFPRAISHTTVHNLCGKVADSYIEEEKEEVKALYKEGVIPESEDRVPPYLFIEADGVNISLQREKERKAEIKAVIAYEGWEEIAKERYKLKEKSVYGGIMGGERFWQGFSLTLAKKYDLGLWDYRLEVSGDGLRGLGAMEGNVDKLFADRMKKGGMSWTKKGANRMAKLISLSRMGKLDEGKRSCAKAGPALLKKEVDASQKKFQEGDGSDWLQAGIPAFCGPHSGRTWVQVLRKLAYGDNKNVAYAGHPEIQPTKS